MKRRIDPTHENSLICAAGRNPKDRYDRIQAKQGFIRGGGSRSCRARLASSLIAILLLAFVLVGAARAGERCLAIDGDTLVCQHRKVRLTNVYAAELNEPGGVAAKRRLQALIGSGELTLKQYGQDRYGRILAEAFVNGRRIEQADIGPRAGRGSHWSGERHHRAVHRTDPRTK